MLELFITSKDHHFFFLFCIVFCSSSFSDVGKFRPPRRPEPAELDQPGHVRPIPQGLGCRVVQRPEEVAVLPSEMPAHFGKILELVAAALEVGHRRTSKPDAVGLRATGPQLHLQESKLT